MSVDASSPKPTREPAYAIESAQAAIGDDASGTSLPAEAAVPQPDDFWRPGADGLMSAEAAAWAIRFFLGREPGNRAEIEFHRQHRDLQSMRKAFSETAPFKAFLAAQRSLEPYRVPLFLLARPADPGIPSKFEPPTLESPVSQLCTAAQMESPEFRYWMEALRLPQNTLHRKSWEFAYICSVLNQTGMMAPGKRAVGFGVGRERLVSLLARFGVNVVATDAPTEVNNGAWGTDQYSSEIEHLHDPAIVDRETFYDRVIFKPADMNAISEELSDFDFCWSACAFEHLGSIRHGLDFVENSLRCLKSGGLAIHTTEFNLSSNDATFESPGLSIFRKKDIEELVARLTRAGHRVMPLNFHPGDRELDAHIDAPPWAVPHLKLILASYTCTSLGVVVFKA